MSPVREVRRWGEETEREKEGEREREREREETESRERERHRDRHIDTYTHRQIDGRRAIINYALYFAQI